MYSPSYFVQPQRSPQSPISRDVEQITLLLKVTQLLTRPLATEAENPLTQRPAIVRAFFRYFFPPANFIFSLLVIDERYPPALIKHAKQFLTESIASSSLSLMDRPEIENFALFPSSQLSRLSNKSMCEGAILLLLCCYSFLGVFGWAVMVEGSALASRHRWPPFGS